MQVQGTSLWTHPATDKLKVVLLQPGFRSSKRRQSDLRTGWFRALLIPAPPGAALGFPGCGRGIAPSPRPLALFPGNAAAGIAQLRPGPAWAAAASSGPHGLLLSCGCCPASPRSGLVVAGPVKITHSMGKHFKLFSC